ncbi:hypothetical protein [Chromobacterium violaceum]|uniref:hypothetical protein n=1 Tax=Chromobacterium violaceum TaxID=536 RepID=UPI001124FEE7|nr:hypothetical protein [Chromobacterium violaceum]MBA8737546.1 hypothetical protein [Chromobacterium violaceum]
MNFQEFKKNTQKFNILKKSDIAGSYHFPTATVSFESLERRDIAAIVQLREKLISKAKLSVQEYESLTKVMPLATHEYTHFVDSTSTVWGMKLLSLMNTAYLSHDNYQKDETQFWQAKRFYDFLRSIALPDYYTLKHSSVSNRPWMAKITAGQVFDKDGKITDRTILFQRFHNSEGGLMVRSPISSVSILEASAMAQEIMSRMSFTFGLDSDSNIIERRRISQDVVDYLYNPNLTEYSVCVHLAANMLGTSDIAIAFAVSSVLTRVCLNLTDAAFDSLAANESLMGLVMLPDEHNFSRRIRDGLRLRDLGTAFYLMTTCLPYKPDLTTTDINKIATQAIKKMGIDPELIHADAIAFGKKVRDELKESPIEPIRWLSEAGLNNLQTINPLSHTINFHALDLPKSLLGDSSEFFILGNPQSPLANKTIDSICDPLLYGQLWIERFAEGCC